MTRAPEDKCDRWDFDPRKYAMIRRGKRYQISTFEIDGYWFVLDTHRVTLDGEEILQYPIMRMVHSRAEARRLAKELNDANSR